MTKFIIIIIIIIIIQYVNNNEGRKYTQKKNIHEKSPKIHEQILPIYRKKTIKKKLLKSSEIT